MRWNKLSQKCEYPPCERGYLRNNYTEECVETYLSKQIDGNYDMLEKGPQGKEAEVILNPIGADAVT
jgi:hypothetical protein